MLENILKEEIASLKMLASESRLNEPPQIVKEQKKEPSILLKIIPYHATGGYPATDGYKEKKERLIFKCS